MEKSGLNVVLAPRLEAYVRAKVEGGAYRDHSEVVSEALRLMQDFEEAKRQRLLEIIDQADRQLANGDYVEYEADQIERIFRETGW